MALYCKLQCEFISCNYDFISAHSDLISHNYDIIFCNVTSFLVTDISQVDFISRNYDIFCKVTLFLVIMNFLFC